LCLFEQLLAHLTQLSAFRHILAHLGTFQQIWTLSGTLVLLLAHLDYFRKFCTFEHISTFGSI